MSETETAGPPDIEVVAGLVMEHGRVLAARRTAFQSFADHWEFPGGKVERGESLEEALEREFQEELGTGVRDARPYDVVTYRNDRGLTVRVSFLRAERRGSDPQPLEVAEVRWVDADELGRLTFIPANRPVVERVIAELRAGKW